MINFKRFRLIGNNNNIFPNKTGKYFCMLRYLIKIRAYICSFLCTITSLYGLLHTSEKKLSKNYLC